MPLLRNVLIFHSGALGDFVLSFPLALALSRLLPTSRIRYITASGKGRLAERVLGVESADVENGFSSLFADGASISPNVAALLAGSHRIYSFVAAPGDVWSRRVAQFAPAAAITHLSTKPSRPGLTVLASLQAQCAGDKALVAALEQILSLLSKQGLVRHAPAGRGIVIHPGAGAREKCWPLENFAALGTLMRGQGHNVHWVLGEVERERFSADDRRIMEAVGDVLSAETQTSLLEELTSAAVVVGNDSGPAHLAAIAGVPTVALFGPTDPAIWTPIGPRVRCLQASGTMADITPQIVAASVTALISTVTI